MQYRDYLTWCRCNLGHPNLQWIQILRGVTIMQISCKLLVRSTQGFQRWVQNWKIDNFILQFLNWYTTTSIFTYPWSDYVRFNRHMERGYRDVCMKVLRPPAAPYRAILLCDRILLNRHVILHRTIPKPYILWKGMLLSRHPCRSCASECNLRHFAAS